MVLAMVRFSVAIVAEPGQPAAVKGWGLIYGAAWGVIVVVMGLGAIAGGAAWPQALAGVTLVVGGWGTFQAFWVWLWLSLERTNARSAGEAETLSPVREAICRRAGQLAVGGLIAVALACIGLEGTRATVAALIAPGHRAITATLTVAAMGFALFMFGTVRGVLNRGKPMRHEEIEENIGRTKYGPKGPTGGLAFRASTYRHFGPAVGAKMEAEASFTGIKDAWRSGAWRRDPFWQTFSIMATGALMMVLGGFGVVVVAGPLVAQVVCGGILGYVTYQLVAAVRRA